MDKEKSSGFLVYIVAKCAGDDKPGCPLLDAHIGKKSLQDWYRAVKFGARMLRDNPEAQMLFVTELNFPWWENSSEMKNYVATAKSFGLEDRQLISIHKGGETTSQLEAAHEFAQETGKDMVVVSTWTHYLRIRWLYRGKGYKHIAAWGTPIIKPAIADVVFTVMFPLIELIGLRPWFISRLQSRRANGKI